VAESLPYTPIRATFRSPLTHSEGRRAKEKKPKDPTIRAKFDTYRLADHKEKVIDLLARVAAVSVATVKITREMPGARA
jgi:hypothetical protein